MNTCTSSHEFPGNADSGNNNLETHVVAGTEPVKPTASSDRSSKLRSILNTLNSSIDKNEYFERIAPSPPLTPDALLSMRVEEPGSIDSLAVLSAPKFRKPGKSTWFRTIGDESQWRCYNTYCPEEAMGSITYIVAPELVEDLKGNTVTRRFAPYITLEGVIAFWPIAVSERPNGWSESARIISGDARHEWRRLTSDQAAQEYKAFTPKIPKPEPLMPPPEELNALFFKAADGLVITSLDHHAVKHLF